MEGSININYGSLARLGVILPSGNQAAEPQFQAMLPQGVSLHTTRLKLTGSTEAELLAMTERVEEAAQLVRDAGATVVLFHCTAVSTFSTALEASILERVRKASGLPAIATSEAIVAALRKLSARRIVMLSPYVDEINRREETYFREHGFEIVASSGLGKADANGMMSVTPREWLEMGLSHRHPDTDAYLISCTTTRSTDVAGQLEAALGKPVITSNTAAFWHALNAMGVAKRPSGFGTLLDAH